LKIDVILDDLVTGQYTNWDSSCYALNGPVLENVTNIFGYAKELGPSPATPPAFAWSIVTWRICSLASEIEHSRERQIEANSRGSIPAPTPLEDVAITLTRMESSELFDKKVPFEDLAIWCSTFGVLEILTQLVNLGMSAFGTTIDRVSRDRFRFLLVHLIRSALGAGIVEYTPELIICAHAIITGDRTFRKWVESDGPRHADPVTAFCLSDESILRRLLIDEARMRYPYELTPLLKFFSALTRGEKPNDEQQPSVATILANMETLMQRLPEGFDSYRSIREEENANWVDLAEDLPQFSARKLSSFGGARRLLASKATVDPEEDMIIPISTIGNIVDDNATPFVALWHYPHSALEYLGKLLSTFAVGSNKVEYSSKQPVSLENASQIIGFFGDLLHSALRGKEATPSTELLTALNIGVDRGQDTVNIVLSIFDQELLRQTQEPGNVESLELLINCIHFVQALVAIAPNRVWPWLTRSQLLESDRNGGSLASILIGTEMVVGQYDFLIGCIQLFQALVDDAVGQSVARKTSNKALTRFNAASSNESGTSDRVMSNTLLVFGRTLASIYEGSLAWKYVRIEDRLDINIGICRAFDSILQYAYGVDDNEKLSSKVTGIIAPIAEYLTLLYLSSSNNDVPTNPLLTSLLSGADVDKSSFMTTSAALWKLQTHTSLTFSHTLVRVAMLLNKPWTHLEQQLFKATPLLARLYATNDGYKSSVVVLLESLVRGAVRGTEQSVTEEKDNSKTAEHAEPPSLLGHLGPRTAKNFLSILSLLDEPLRMVNIQTKVWNLLSAVVTCKQQWFALYLLTGSTPRETVRSRATSGSGPQRNKALLLRALESITRISLERANIDWPLYTAMLEFISSAQNNWSWAMGDLRQHKDFIQKLLAFLKWIPGQQTDIKTLQGAVTRSYLNKFASLTCEILAMYLHSSRQVGDVAPLKDIVPSLSYFEDNALKQPEYNVSLHSMLKRNFESQFRGVSLSSLKRTTLHSAPFGQAFFYDIELANKLLHFNSNWNGSRGQGYSADVVRANLNLGLVESQIQLLKAWKLLAVELSNVVAQDERLAKILIKVVKDSMITNADSALPEHLFGQLTILRADLSFVLLQRMVNAKIKYPEARNLLTPIWNAVRAATPDFDTVFSSDAVHYYRSLLRILYLALQFHLLPLSDSASEEASFRSSFRASLPASSKTLVEPISTQLLEILSDTVAKGFRSLATQLHADPESIAPSDFALLTAMLQTILAIPEMTTWHGQAALLFSNSNTLRYATSLFSWADRLTLNNDPIYGELSLLFILSLSSLQSLAEPMAVEGILAQINTANLMNYYRRPGGMSPFDNPARLFSIWTKGLLPLCLNLLRAVGPAIAGEISAFLNQFPEQLSRASNALNSRTANKITLSIASETHSLALISAILEGDRAQGPRLGREAGEIMALNWDKENVKEDIEGWIARKGALRERIVVTDETEEALFKKKLQSDEAENALEQRVLLELLAAGECLGVGKSGEK
jgi:nuclear pore complex protein Nup188